MAGKKMFLLDGMSFEQLLGRMWREFEQKNLREAERKSIPQNRIRGAGRITAKQSAAKSHVRSTAA